MKNSRCIIPVGILFGKFLFDICQESSLPFTGIDLNKAVVRDNWDIMINIYSVSTFLSSLQRACIENINWFCCKKFSGSTDLSSALLSNIAVDSSLKESLVIRLITMMNLNSMMTRRNKRKRENQKFSLFFFIFQSLFHRQYLPFLSPRI